MIDFTTCLTAEGIKSMVNQPGSGHRLPPGPAGAFRRLRQAALVCLSLLAGLSTAQAEYAISGGDALDITVAGMPALRRKAIVNADGAVSFPLLGIVPVAGLSVAGVRDRLQKMLAERNLAANPDVTVEIVEYPPIYVMGDVFKPGAYPFRPGLSVRNAIALAGGYDQQQLRGRNPLLDATNARGDYQLAAVELAKQQARIARLKAELAGQQQFDIVEPRASSVGPETLAEIIRIETQQLQLELESRKKESAYFTSVLKTTEDQIAQLVMQESYWTSSVQQQTTDLDNMRNLLRSSVGTISRVDDAQQRVLLSQSRLFDVRARLAQLRRDVSDVSRKQDTSNDENRSALLLQLRDSVVDLTKTRYALDVAADKMQLSGRVRQRDNAPRVVVYGAAEEGSMVAESTTLVPGATIEVTFVDKTASWLSDSADTGPGQVGDSKQRPAAPGEISSHR
jgi:polysaccharide export outer membrane protein